MKKKWTFIADSLDSGPILDDWENNPQVWITVLNYTVAPTDWDTVKVTENLGNTAVCLVCLTNDYAPEELLSISRISELPFYRAFALNLDSIWSVLLHCIFHTLLTSVHNVVSARGARYGRSASFYKMESRQRAIY